MPICFAISPIIAPAGKGVRTLFPEKGPDPFFTSVTFPPRPVTLPRLACPILPHHRRPDMKRIHIVAATVAALAVLSGGALYVRSSSAESKPAAMQPQALPVP